MPGSEWQVPDGPDGWSGLSGQSYHVTRTTRPDHPNIYHGTRTSLRDNCMLVEKLKLLPRSSDNITGRIGGTQQADIDNTTGRMA